jgi:hypothetical protein
MKLVRKLKELSKAVLDKMCCKICKDCDAKCCKKLLVLCACLAGLAVLCML